MNGHHSFHYEEKRFLICQPLIHNINGSTLVTFELAKYLKNKGSDVTVYTCTLDNPARELFEKSNLKVLTPNSSKNLKLRDFDYIWIHSQVLPKTIIEDLGKNHSKYPIFIFLHMSSMDWLPDEHPYILNLEEQLSDLSLYICEEVRKSNTGFFLKEPEYGYFRNPAPSYFLPSAKRKKKLEKILFVSNYLPEELYAAKEELARKGYFVKFLGEDGDDYKLLTPNMLQQYDAVISIAKTAQYCLINNTPIYIYGKFGGCGWLNKKNYKKAKSCNFCGSDGFSHKTSKKIITEFLSGYDDAFSFQHEYHEKFQKDLLIDNVLDDLLLMATNKQKNVLLKQEVAALVAAQEFSNIRFAEWTRAWNNEKDIKKLKKQNEDLRKIVNSKSVKLWLKINRIIKSK